jgi:twitching motility protein PilT
MSRSIKDLLQIMATRNASDLHLKVGSPPGFRVNGELEPEEGAAALSKEEVRSFIEELVTDDQRKTYDSDYELDFSVGIPGVARFRVNIFHQRGTCAAVMRKIPVDVPPLDGLGFPDVVRKLCCKPRGLVLVTGPTGSGKSTTLAAMVDYINRNDRAHILTLEDPIEFMHKDKKCFVNQREIGSDSKSFARALRSALREDPDIIMVGEMRDLETITLAVTAAETGHLVFGTLHTTSAIQTMDRIVDVFPHEAQQQIRTQLSNTLQGVISQVLLPQIGGGRACAQEIMTGTCGVRNLIREGKTAQLLNMLQTGGAYGMQTLETALEHLIQEKKITPDVALSKANNPGLLRQGLARMGVKVAEGETSREKPSSQEVAQRFAQATGEQKAKEAPAAGLVTQSAGGGGDSFEQFRNQRKPRS